MPVNAPGSQLTAEGERPGWARLRAVAGGPAVWLCGDRPGWAGICQLCRGPARPGRSLCFQCDLQAQSAPGSLADAVVPIAYAVKGGGHARDLWTYKSGGPAAAEAGLRLAVLLALFLREHGSCLWRAAGICGPTHVGVVPSGRGRAGMLVLLKNQCSGPATPSRRSVSDQGLEARPLRAASGWSLV